jgi:hypothetical protein
MTLPYLSLVRLNSDRHRAEGVDAGALSVVVEVYGDGTYEVEFSDSDGTTIALLSLDEDELVPVSEPISVARPQSAD